MSTARDFRKLDVVIVILSAITYLLDVATDVLVTVQYMFDGELMWFTLTLAFIVVPMVLMQVFSLKWYLAEVNARISFLNGFLHSIGLALLKRYANVLMTWNDVKTSADPALIEKLFLQINDVFLLRLFQCFLESAPQLILNTYVAISQWYISVSSGFSIFFSLVSLVWGFATYTDILRLTYRDSYQRKWSGLLLQVGWQIGMVISRIVAIVMFAICFQGWIFLPIFIHWMMMTIWVVAEKPKFSSIWWEDKLYSCVVGFIYIFCFLNVQEGRTRWRMFFFYALQLLENSLIVVTWMIADHVQLNIYQWLFTALVYIGFLIGVVCLLLFYGCYHPDKLETDNSSEEEIGQDVPSQTVQSLRRSSRRVQISSSSITSNTSLMNKDPKQSDYNPFPFRREPIGCPDVSTDIRFLQINDGTPTFKNSTKFPAFNHGMLQDEEEIEASPNKIFSSTAVDEETPRPPKRSKGTTPEHILKQDQSVASDPTEGTSGVAVNPTRADSKKLIPKFGSRSQQTLPPKSQKGETDDCHLMSYSPEKGYVRNLKSPPPPSPVSHQEKSDRHHPLGRHNSENIRLSSQVSTVDNLSNKYQHFRESWDGSDRYLQMLEKYCDRDDHPPKYTYLNSVYEPTTKPMERKNKANPFTKLRSSFRRHLETMRNLNYKEMSPVLNPHQYFTSRESLKSNSGPSLLQCQNLPHSDASYSGETQCRMFCNTYHSKDHKTNPQNCSQDFTYQSSQPYVETGQCLRYGQGYEQTSLCNHGCGHKRRSYSETCTDDQVGYNQGCCIQQINKLETANHLNNPHSYPYYANPEERRSPYNHQVNPSFLTLPRKPNNFSNGHTASSAFVQCYPTLRNSSGPYMNPHYPSNDLSTYVVYSDKPSVNRCTSAPPHPPQEYNRSLRRTAMAGNRRISEDPVVDHNDFRYCTVSSVRSESAPPTENFIRASFRNHQRLCAKSDTLKSNHETPNYDFRQLTVSPVQSMSVPPDRINDLEALRNLTVSPVRSVSVMPNQSPPEQECFNNCSQLPTRSASVPPDFLQTYNPPNALSSQVTILSDSSDTSFSYCTSTDRPMTPTSSQSCNTNFIYGKMSSDGSVSVPSVSHLNYMKREDKSSSLFKSGMIGHPSVSSELTPHVGVSDSTIFSCNHPYLLERKLSVPYNSQQSASNSEDSQSVTSFSSLPDSTSESLPRYGVSSSGDTENKEGSKLDLEFKEVNTVTKRSDENKYKEGSNFDSKEVNTVNKRSDENKYKEGSNFDSKEVNTVTKRSDENKYKEGSNFDSKEVNTVTKRSDENKYKEGSNFDSKEVNTVTKRSDENKYKEGSNFDSKEVNTVNKRSDGNKYRIVQPEFVKRESGFSCQPKVSQVNGSKSKLLEDSSRSLKNGSKFKSMKKMSLHISEGVSIEPDNNLQTLRDKQQEDEKNGEELDGEDGDEEGEGQNGEEEGEGQDGEEEDDDDEEGEEDEEEEGEEDEEEEGEDDDDDDEEEDDDDVEEEHCLSTSSEDSYNISDKNQNIGLAPTRAEEYGKPIISVLNEREKKQERFAEEVSSDSESNLSGIFGHQFTQSYAPIDPGQFSLQKFRDCSRSELYSPEVSKIYTKKISPIDFYNKPIQEKSSLVNSCSLLPSLENQRRDDDEDGDMTENGIEEIHKKKQIPKHLPQEKLKTDQPPKNKNLILSPLIIKQLKSSPLKLGRSLSISSVDKSRLSKLRDKLSPLRIQNLVHSPFKFGRNIDLFDRKRWRSANDIVHDSNLDKNVGQFVKAKILENSKDLNRSFGESKSAESVSSSTERDLSSKVEESESDSDPSSLGTLIDCDWALDVLDQLSRVSDSHGSNLSGDSRNYKKYASWTNLTELPKQEKEDREAPDGIPKLTKEIKTNTLNRCETAQDDGEESDKRSRHELDSKLNKDEKRPATAGGNLQFEFEPEKALKKGSNIQNIAKDKNRIRNTKSKTNHEEDIPENGFVDNSIQELDFKNQLTTYQEFKRELSPLPKDSLDVENQKVFDDSTEKVTKQDVFRDEDFIIDASFSFCENVNSSEIKDKARNKPMTKNLNKGRSPSKSRTKTYYAQMNTDAVYSQEADSRNSSFRQEKELIIPNNKIKETYKNLYQDVDISVVHEECITLEDVSENTENMACWENWNHYQNKDEFEHFRNSLIQETLSDEMCYPWESSISDSDENADSSREGPEGLLNKAFLSENRRQFRRSAHCYWPRSRYPRTVSRPVDPLLMPTIHEYKMMTEQFIYDDETTENYQMPGPQLTIPAYELYNDRKSKTNKYSSYFREKSFQSLNDSSLSMYKTVPMRESSYGGNSSSSRNSGLEEFYPKTDMETFDSHAFL